MSIHLDPVPQVWGITGNLGGGKTLTAVSLAAYAMSRGYFVVTNVTLKMDQLADMYGQHVRKLYRHFSFEDQDFDPFALPAGTPRGERGGKRVLVIMDECAEWIDQYTNVERNPKIKRFLSWLRHSSKRSQDVILIVQRLDYLNKNIRILISKWVIVDDLLVWRIPVLKARIPFMGGWCMQRVFDSHKKLVQGPFIVKKAAVGRYYRTAECLNSTGATILYEYEQPRVTQVNLQLPLALYALSLSLLCLASCEWSAKYDAHDRPPNNAHRTVVSQYPERTLSDGRGQRLPPPPGLPEGRGGALASGLPESGPNGFPTGAAKAAAL